MPDIYLYDDVPVLKNKLGIKNEATLDLVESEQSSANMILLYDEGFDDFTPAGVQAIHRALFQDIYDWAGAYRVINIQKREAQLGGRSVWYSNDDDIGKDLERACDALAQHPWEGCTRPEFVHALTRLIPPIWQVHPFREGNTRTVVMLMTFFVENHGFYMDQELMAASAGYVRDAFVLASLDQNSDFEPLERILMDAVCETPVAYMDEEPLEQGSPSKFTKYQKEPYTSTAHELRDE